jgi:hypothetical protein
VIKIKCGFCFEELVGRGDRFDKQVQILLGFEIDEIGLMG